jgi:hypothetical protein
MTGERHFLADRGTPQTTEAPRIADVIAGQDRLASKYPVNVGYCEGFRKTAHRARLPLALGRLQKASREGTRGDVDDPVPQGLWRLMVEGSDWTRRMTARWSAS